MTVGCRAAASREASRPIRRLASRVAGDAPEDGNAIVEFVYLAVLLMVPLVYVLLTLFRIQAASFAVSSASREAGRVYASSTDLDAADTRARAAARLVMADSNLTLQGADLDIACESRPCLRPGSTVAVVLTYQVDLPFLPSFLRDRAPASIRVTGRHLEVVDRYRSAAR